MNNQAFDLATAKVDQQLFYRIPTKYLEENRVIPILEPEDGLVQVAMVDPDNIELLDDIQQILNAQLEVHQAPEEQILAAIERCSSGDAQSVEKVIQDLTEDDLEIIGNIRSDQDGVDVANEAPIIKLVNLIIWNALQTRASDIHIEPFENQLLVRYRVDGVLHEASSPPPNLHAAVISRIKIMADLDISERRTTQDGRIQIKLGRKEIDIRVAIIPTVWGESVVMRLLDKTGLMLDLTDLGFERRELDRYEQLIDASHGIILVTGPTGSGKTTTLYTALSALNSPERKIITVEDPVEYQLEGINQIQAKSSIGLDFAHALRAIVRQDPDVIMIGEMRDLETARIAIQSALTGHLVLSTIHTNDAAGGITRMLDMGVEDYLLTSTVNAILAQRLVRTLDTEHREAFEVLPEVVDEIGLRALGERDRYVFYKPVPTPENPNGYHGRTSILELLVMSDPIRRLVIKHATSGEIQNQAVSEGMRTMYLDGLNKCLAGITTLDEVLRVTQEA
jgi:general secretion pathway protein E